MSTDNIQYPALLQHPDDDELDVVSCSEDWVQKCRSQAFVAGLYPGVRLIDSQGRVYPLTLSCARVQLQDGTEQLSLDQVLQLVRLHASLQGSCCVAKIGARSIADAILLVVHLSD
ncbi:DUF4144 domain-containing protein [Marinobacterium rhizophilum]|uniref:Uncharacterized protein n=1 Tax=Marinobacterium rhizophilum TaxID=420402 RepID=A0ABY5HLU4_9GAMM|nr:DUF4144 domain-containing protein [Marinobacterium rhizophilum]UTW12866.1 hypothetical protein KDW95_04090 [Marinobacterium rhizophilum]